MKSIAVIGVLLLALVAGLLASCGEGGMSQEEIDQLVDDVLRTNARVDTYQFEMNIQETIEMSGGDAETVNVTMAGDATGAIDVANKRIRMDMNMSMEMPGEAAQDMQMATYLVDGWMYMKLDLPTVGASWMKMQMPEEMWEQQNKLDLQTELLSTAVAVNYLGSETVGGTDCYVMEIEPSPEALADLLSQAQMPGMEKLDLAGLNLANIIKEIKLKEWIAKDSLLILKMEEQVIIEMIPEDLGVSEEIFSKMTADVSIGMTFYDYNKAVSIELPEEAQEAMEMPGS